IHTGTFACFQVKFFPEIMEQELSARHGSFSITHHFLQQRLANFLFGNRFSAHELFELFYVLIGIKGKAMAFSPIPSGTTCFLIIAFKTRSEERRVGKDDISRCMPKQSQGNVSISAETR